MAASDPGHARPNAREEQVAGTAPSVVEPMPGRSATPLVVVGAVMCAYAGVDFQAISGIGVALGLPASFVVVWALSRSRGDRRDAELLVALGVLAAVPLIHSPVVTVLLASVPPEGLTYVWPTAVAGAGLAVLGRAHADNSLLCWGAAATASALVAAPLRQSHLNGVSLTALIVSAAALCLLVAGFEGRARGASGSSGLQSS